MTAAPAAATVAAAVTEAAGEAAAVDAAAAEARDAKVLLTHDMMRVRSSTMACDMGYQVIRGGI